VGWHEQQRNVEPEPAGQHTQGTQEPLPTPCEVYREHKERPGAGLHPLLEAGRPQGRPDHPRGRSKGVCMKRVGRPPLAYDVKHVTLNIKVEHYKRMRRDGSNMSRVINNYLDDLYAYSICPSCYGDDFRVLRCAKCDGRMLVCDSIACKHQGMGQRRECHNLGEPCTVDEFNG